MRVAYVSKALTVAAYRDKLRALSAHVEVRALVPARWDATEREGGERDPGGAPWSAACEPGAPAGSAGRASVPARIDRLPVLFAGHNHFHVYRGARRWLEAMRPDLLHVDEEPYSAVTFQLVRLARRLGVPALFFAWQNLDKRLPPPFGAMRARVFRGVAGAIAGTEAAAAVLRRAGYAGPLAVVPQFGVDAARFAPDARARAAARRRLGIGDAAFVVGYGGRLVPEKGVDVLLAAAAQLPGAHVAILGDGRERRRLEELARRGGIAERVHFVGHVPSLEMPGWLPALDALALPSRRSPGWVEQFGRILVEAMACGVPVVGAATGEIPNVIGDAGAVVPEGDANALAAALRALGDDPGRRTELGRRARRRVLERYTNERVAADTAAFYHAILERHARGAPTAEHAASAAAATTGAPAAGAGAAGIDAAGAAVPAEARP
ncbi:MAG TPA: glycosyltransferase family 4 protein [Longimicrobiales bacterium]